MTNRELASILADKLYSRFVNSSFLKGGNALEGTVEEIIEQSINEAEKRGYEKCRAEATENGKELIKEAQRIGSEQMRIEAVKICIRSVKPSTEGCFNECTKNPYELADEIRALPLIEGESK